MSHPANTIIRPVSRSDQGYVTATWWRSMLGANRAPHRRRRLNDQIDRVLDDPTTRALVAERGDRILGWIVYASAPAMRVLHYAYVRDEERGQGVCQRLINAAWPGSSARLVLTCQGPHTRTFIANHAGKAIFLPAEEFLR